MAGNKNLNAALKAKKDEFYTQMDDIASELNHYRQHFRNKVVFCNCDDPYESNFFKYFALNFNSLGLKKLIATCYDGSPVQGNELLLHFDDWDAEPTKIAYKVEISEVTDCNGDGAINLSDVRYLMQNDKNVLSRLKGNGDFRSPECVELLKQADIIVTNPPFSLFREYVAQLMKYEKKFLIIGNNNAVTYKEIFPLIMGNQIWLGYYCNKTLEFVMPDTYERWDRIENGMKIGKVPAISWFTNLDIAKRHEELDLWKNYTPEEYPRYDNYDAINVDKVADIPCDYDGVMGVPITFMDKFNPKQFEVLGITDRGNEYGLKTKEYTKQDTPKYGDLNRRGALWVNGELKSTFAKLLIRRRK